jgi:nifR3 family TIM-barrel protein
MRDNNFWKKLKASGKPILALAPMAGFTDSAFRRICKGYGADVLYSEMVSATALYYSDRIGTQKKGKNSKNPTIELMDFKKRAEKYYVVQLFGSKPEHFAAAAKLITAKIKPDGIDINFGCPVSKIIKQGAGADLMKNLAQSRAVIEAVLAETNLPVSIKIRAKSGEMGAIEFLKNISDLNIAAVMIHGRTLSQGFAGKPDFKLIKEVRKYFPGVVIANGGIIDLASAQEALKESGADGLGLARGILGRPWLFKEIKKNKQLDLKISQIFKLIISHATRVSKIKGKNAMIELRKHLVWYVQGLEGASKMREKLVTVNNLQELKKIIKEYKK